MFRTAVILAILVGIAQAHAASPKTIENRLVEALTCQSKDNSLEVVRAIAGKKKELAVAGMTIVANDEEGYDEVIEIAPPRPLRLANATTRKVTLAFDNPYPNFRALVYAEFRGDPGETIRRLKLIEGKTVRYPIAAYVSREARRHGCPEHIGLSVLDKNRFVLGCGWCNG